MQSCGNNSPVSSYQPKQRETAALTGDDLMRPMCLILAAALFVATSSMAGSSESGMPGVGTFAYAGSTLAPAAPQTVVLAAR
jgi:hypothetical protein